MQLRDAADMIVIDSVLSQEDRMGNVAYLSKQYYLDTSSGKPVVKEPTKKDGAHPPSLVTVKEMILKDNDCGVSRQNLSMKYGLPSKIAHIDPTTYQNLLRFNSILDQAATKEFFETELLFTQQDYDKLRANTNMVARQLHQALRGAAAETDLDVQAHFSGEAPQTSCD